MPEIELSQKSTGPKVRRKRRKRVVPQPSLLAGYPGDFRAFVEAHGDFGLDRDVLFRVWACIREAVLAEVAEAAAAAGIDASSEEAGELARRLAEVRIAE